MKKLLTLILILILSIAAQSATKHVKATGGDYSTIAQVNAALGTGIVAGDSVLFYRGETFTGTITASAFLPASEITFGAYGTGANPIISGFTDVTAWTNQGSNIWESTNAVSALTSCMMVTVNGTLIPMGKIPNSGYYTYQSHTTSSITSSNLSGTPNWTGAEIALQLYPWTIGRCVITSQSGGTVNFTKTGADVSPYADGQKFIIQNDIRTLDAQNEWYYNPTTKKLSMYSTSQPSGVKVANTSQIVALSGSQNLKFENLTFQGSNTECISITDCDNITLSGCTIQFAGRDGISGEYTNNSNNLLIADCIISEINNNGIDLTDDFTNAIIRSNTISNVGMNIGMTVTGSGNGNSSGQLIAVNVAGAGSLTELNSISYSGYHGIQFKNDGSIVQKNIVSTFCQVLTDGAGVYTWNGIPAGVTHSGMKILNNIVLDGASDKGIYLDDAANGLEVKNNTVSGCRLGIYLHNSYNSLISNNTTFDCDYGLYMYNNDLDVPMTNQNINSNKFIAKSSSQKTYFSDYTERIQPVYLADSNYYARPIDDGLTIRYIVRSPSYSNLTVSLTTWKTYTGQEIHSQQSPSSITSEAELHLAYNASSTAQAVSIPFPAKEINGTPHYSSITLQPYTSAVLFRDDTILPITPAGTKYQKNPATGKYIINPSNGKIQVL